MVEACVRFWLARSIAVRPAQTRVTVGRRVYVNTWGRAVTATLSREFYDRPRDKVVDDLVGLLNDIDATFHAELSELNEHNFRRFAARLAQQIADLGSELRLEITSLNTALVKWMFLFWLPTPATMLSFGRSLPTR